MTDIYTPAQIAGYRAQLKGAVNACDNGAEVTLDLTTAEKLVEIIDQLRVVNQAEAKRYEVEVYQQGRVLDDVNRYLIDDPSYGGITDFMRNRFECAPYAFRVVEHVFDPVLKAFKIIYISPKHFFSDIVYTLNELVAINDRDTLQQVLYESMQLNNWPKVVFIPPYNWYPFEPGDLVLGPL